MEVCLIKRRSLKMRTIIMYYTFGGSSRKEANRIADENVNSVLCEIKEEKKRNIITI